MAIGNSRLSMAFYLNGDWSESEGSQPINRSPKLDDLHAYWNRIRAERVMPARSEIDPTEIPALLPHIVMTEVVYDPLDFLYRLVGNHVVTHAGRSIQGSQLSTLLTRGDERDEELQTILFGIGRAVVEHRAPICAELEYLTIPNGHGKRLQTICLPLSVTGESVDFVVSAAVYERQENDETFI